MPDAAARSRHRKAVGVAQNHLATSASAATRPGRAARRRLSPGRTRSAAVRTPGASGPIPTGRRSRGRNHRPGRSRMSRGVPHTASAARHAGSRRHRRARSATSMSCVTNRMVLPVAAWMSASSAASASRVIGIERAERLVHQQELGIGGQRAGDADALLLPARKLVRIFAAMDAWSSRSSSISSRDARVDARLWPAEEIAARSRCCARPSNAERARSTGWHSRCGGAAPRAAARAISSPPMRIAPELSGTRRLTIFSVVDLPAPDEPTSAQNCAALDREADSRRRRAARHTSCTTFRNSIMATLRPQRVDCQRHREIGRERQQQSSAARRAARDRWRIGRCPERRSCRARRRRPAPPRRRARSPAPSRSRTPGEKHRQAQRQLDPPENLAPRHAHAGGALDHRRIDAERCPACVLRATGSSE